MAVTTQKSDQLTNLDSSPPVLADSMDVHGRLRIAFFSFTQSGAGDAGSSVEIARLPPGKCRILGSLCNVEAAVAAASATVDIGWDAFVDLDGEAVAADTDGLLDGGDIDTTANIDLTTPGTNVAATKTFESRDGVSIRATVVTAIADTETIDGYLVYSYD